MFTLAWHICFIVALIAVCFFGGMYVYSLGYEVVRRWDEEEDEIFP